METAGLRHLSLCLLAAGSPAVAAAGQGVTIREESRIAADGPSWELNRVGGMTTDRQGRLWVVSRDESALQVFTSSGGFVRTVGRAGSGPGEFRSPGTIGTRADSVWVGDVTLARISVLGPDGRPVRTIAVPFSGSAWLMADGSVLAAPLVGFGRDANLPQRLGIVRLAPGATRLDTVVTVSSPRTALRYQGASGTIVGAQPFEAVARIAVAPDGSGLTVVQPPANGFLVIRTWDARGRRAGERTLDWRPVPVSAEMVERRIDLLAGGSRGDAALRKRIRAALVIPAHLPPVTDAIRGVGESLWLRREELGGATQRWTVLSGPGSRDIILPADIQPMVVWADGFWGIRWTSDDLPAIMRYALLGG